MEELLRLLAEDAPGSELARAAGSDQAARDLALRIRAGMDASKKREAELSALVDVAESSPPPAIPAACSTRSCTAPAP